MPKMNYRAALDWGVNLVILATCAIVASAVVQNRARDADFDPRNVFRTGDAAEVLPGVKYDDAQATLVLYVRSTCHYCSASMPFYRSISERLGRAARIKLVAVSDEEPGILTDYLNANGLRVDVPVQFQGRSRGTPTVVLVDNAGRVRNVWIGQQPKEGEQRVMAALSTFE